MKDSVVQVRDRRVSHPGSSSRASVAVACAALIALALLPPSAQAASTSPGKNAAFESATGVLLSAMAPQLTATISKGKKKTVLAIEVSYSDGAWSPTPLSGRVLGLRVTVNGFGVQPNAIAPYDNLIDCGFGNPPPAACTASGTFWFDIDAAELANPGLFVGQPLSVVLSAGDLTGGPLVGVQSMDATLSVRVQKK